MIKGLRDEDHVNAASEMLESAGVTYGDAQVAARLGSTILCLHRLCSPTGRGLLAYDTDGSIDLADCRRGPGTVLYTVYVPNLCDRMTRVHHTPKGQWPLDLEPHITAVAAHEVRHWLQRSLPGVRLFSPRRQKRRRMRTLTDGTACAIRTWFILERKYRRAHGQAVQSFRSRTNAEEFDATVVEFLVLMHLPYCRSIHDVADIVRTNEDR